MLLRGAFPKIINFESSMACVKVAAAATGFSQLPLLPLVASIVVIHVVNLRASMKYQRHRREVAAIIKW